MSDPKKIVANSTAYAASLIVSANTSILLFISGYNSLASAQFIQLHDSATVPANGAAPIAVITVPASSNFTIAIPTSGMLFKKGIVVANSTTGPTLTIGALNCYFTAVYKLS